MTDLSSDSLICENAKYLVEFCVFLTFQMYVLELPFQIQCQCLRPAHYLSKVHTVEWASKFGKNKEMLLNFLHVFNMQSR